MIYVIGKIIIVAMLSAVPGAAGALLATKIAKSRHPQDGMGAGLAGLFAGVVVYVAAFVLMMIYLT